MGRKAKPNAVIDKLIDGLRGPVGADLEIETTPELRRQIRARVVRVTRAIDDALHAAAEEGLPVVVALKVSLASALCQEVEHVKRELLQEIGNREDRQVAAALLASSMEHGDA